MSIRQSYTEILCGIFVSATTVVDWYWNASLRYRPFSPEEQYRFEMFLERPVRVLPPPEHAWEIVLCLAIFFFTGYVSTKMSMDFYQSRHSLSNRYLKSIALVAVTIGLCSGSFLFTNADLLPTVWKIYLSIAWSIVASWGIYLALLLPYQWSHWWKEH